MSFENGRCSAISAAGLVTTGVLVDAGSAAFERMRAITVPIGTTSFTLKKVSSSTPSAVEGTSLSTLSVAISRTASSIFTVSPGCLYHFKMVASIILSPILGITRSTKAICNCRFYSRFYREVYDYAFFVRRSLGEGGNFDHLR